MKKLHTLFTNILNDKVLAPFLFVSFGAFFGIIVLNASFFQASLLQPQKSLLNEREVVQMLTETQNVRDVEITSLSENTFLVEFSATEGTGDSLHSFQYIVTKEGKTLVGIKEVSTPSSTEDNVITEPIDVQIK
jgi:hypothetical protein